MPCLLLLIGAAVPRILLVVLYLFTDWFRGIYDNFLVLVLGFFLLPMSTLWYAVVQYYYGGEWSLFPIIGMVIALATDVGAWRGGAKERSRR